MWSLSLTIVVSFSIGRPHIVGGCGKIAEPERNKLAWLVHRDRELIVLEYLLRAPNLSSQGRGADKQWRIKLRVICLLTVAPTKQFRLAGYRAGFGGSRAEAPLD
jgi:hypothetical protein